MAGFGTFYYRNKRYSDYNGKDKYWVSNAAAKREKYVSQFWREVPKSNVH
jgi:hypothetical protein